MCSGCCTIYLKDKKINVFWNFDLIAPSTQIFFQKTLVLPFEANSALLSQNYTFSHFSSLCSFSLQCCSIVHNTAKFEVWCGKKKFYIFFSQQKKNEFNQNPNQSGNYIYFTISILDLRESTVHILWGRTKVVLIWEPTQIFKLFPLQQHFSFEI